MTRRRSIRRRSLLPATPRSTRERRELVVSFSIVALLQLGITVALVVSALQTYQMWREGVPYIPRDVARVVPASFLLGALLALFATSRSLRRVWTIHRAPIDPGPDA